MLRTRSSTAILGAIAVLMSGTTLAQGPDAGALQRNLEQQVPKAEAQPNFRLKVQPPPPKAVEDKNSFELKGIKFTGVTLVSEAELQAALKSWINLKVTFAQLDEITVAVMQFYRERGLIAQAVVPPQTVQGGILEIRVIESKLSDVRVKSASGEAIRFSAEKAKAYVLNKNPLGGVVSPNQIEEAVTLINELSGVRANGTLEAGAALGETVFDMVIEDLPFFAGAVQGANQGSRSTGIAQLTANLAFNNLSGSGDSATLYGIASEGSQYGQLAYRLPLGYDGWRVGVNASYLNYRNIGQYATNNPTGTASVVGVNASYPLVREGASSVSFNASLDHKNYENLIAAGTASKYQIDNLTIGLMGNNTHDLLGVVGMTSWGVNLVTGRLDIQDPNQLKQDSTTARTDGNFQKITFNALRKQGIINDMTAITVSINGQLGFQNLNSAEQFYLGGPYGVRAYPISQSGGSSGALMSVELSHALNSNFQISAFLDAGWVKQHQTLWANWQGLTGANNHYSLAGAGVGAKWMATTYQVSATIATPLGTNPLKNNAGQTVNSDGRRLEIQPWLSASFYF